MSPIVITDRDLGDHLVRNACALRERMIYAVAECERAGRVSAEAAAGQRKALESARFVQHSPNKVLVTVPTAHRQYGAVPTQILQAVAAVHSRTRDGEFLPFSGNAGAILIW